MTNFIYPQVFDQVLNEVLDESKNKLGICESFYDK